MSCSTRTSISKPGQDSRPRKSHRLSSGQWPRAVRSEALLDDNSARRFSILARDIPFRAVHEPLAEMAINFVNALAELVVRHFAEGSEVGRLSGALQKFACQLLRMSFDTMHQPRTAVHQCSGGGHKDA